MGEAEFVTKPLIITASCTFSLPDLCAVINSFFSKYGYDALPNHISETQNKSGNKDFFMHMVAERSEDDYHDSVIHVKIWGKNLAPAKRKHNICSHGSVKIAIKSLINLDVKNKWNKNFFTIFIRALYDKFADAKRHASYNSELDKDTRALHDELKAFFNIETMKK